MGIFDWLRRKQKQPASVAEDRRATPVDNAISRLSVASDEARVGAAMELLKSSDHEVRAAVASEVARLEIKAVGVWYELANALADDHESVRQASAKAFWQLDGVGYAIRSLRDEHENPAHMNRESALRGIHTLMEVAPEKSNFDDLLKENWQDCPILKRDDLSKSEKLPEQKDSDERPECVKCGCRFKWDEAYKCQDTPGAMAYTPQGYGDDLARVFCPHCGAIVVQWHITSEKDYDEWAWFRENATINQGRPLPPSPNLYGWGISIPSQFVPEYNQHRLDIEKIEQQTALSSAEADSEISKAMNLVSKFEDVRTMSLDSALFTASEHGINEAVRILLRAGANPNYKAPSGWTPLLMAAGNGHVEAVRALLQKGADPNDQDVFAAHTPLILASKNKHIEVVKTLVEAGADVNRQNQWGHSALKWAQGNAELEKILKEA